MDQPDRVSERTKRCSGCGETKPASKFHKNSTRSDGLQTHCIACKQQGNAAKMRAKYARNPRRPEEAASRARAKRKREPKSRPKEREEKAIPEGAGRGGDPADAPISQNSQTPAARATLAEKLSEAAELLKNGVLSAWAVAGMAGVSYLALLEHVAQDVEPVRARAFVTAGLTDLFRMQVDKEHFAEARKTLVDYGRIHGLIAPAGSRTFIGQQNNFQQSRVLVTRDMQELVAGLPEGERLELLSAVAQEMTADVVEGELVAL